MRRKIIGLGALLLATTLYTPVLADGDHDDGHFTKFTGATCYEAGGQILRRVAFRTTTGGEIGFEESNGNWSFFSKMYGYFGPKPVCIKVNSKYLVPDVPPVIEQDRTLVPLRAVAESFSDVTIDWDGSTRSVNLTQHIGRGITWVLHPGDPIVTMTDLNRPPGDRSSTRSMEVPPIIRDGRTMVPLRFIAETIGAKVQWDEQSRRVLITRDEGA